ncbi:hypothetical protein FQ087_02940 [Sporosarcina sp. ANT_H38]|uniref:hypothetical protein n=1 Tax=Sporosarcina sp. ANT_H38 TaxID=2597358 RepID=UPI0011F396A2|nr:hypothetical protein [Sporosarcina sp. ANT_H38]KAA0965281.1 hypothetical protein FQ087_02940 [Sporosarcina sp. ANT_H38]
MTEQKELDIIFSKIEKDYKQVTNKEMTRLVQLINYKFAGNDFILNQLSKVELIKALDFITRASFELTNRKGLFDKSSKHYILSNFYKAKKGLDSPSRKELFIEKDLFIYAEFDIRKMFIEFKFKVINNEPILLIKHIFGYGSITNFIEIVLEEIQNNYLVDVGYEVDKDKIGIFYKDIQIDKDHLIYDKVEVEEGIVNPKWSSIDGKWFEEIWGSIGEVEEKEDNPVFFQNNKPYTGYMKVKELFCGAKKSIQLIDPYINEVLLTLIQELDPNINIQVITDKLQGDSEIQYKALKKERGNLEVRKSKDNHDRYLILDEEKVYLFGCSINSMGNKASTIVPIEHKFVEKQIIDYFNLSWNEKTSTLR